MRADATRQAAEVEAGAAGARGTRTVVEDIAREMTRASARIEGVAASMQGLDASQRRAHAVHDAIEASASEVAAEIRAARSRSDEMMAVCGALVQRAVQVEADGPVHAYVRYATDRAARLGAAMEARMRAGQIAERDLFRFEYARIGRTEPAQHDAPFARFTDAVAQDLLEAALDFDPFVVFCTLCDRNGYIPTHDRRFSRPPGSDPVWNAVHCRNRRIFDDRVGRKAGANTDTFLLQVHRRDMGGAAFVMMNDLSAPLFVAGRH